jgi:hypothetical protein
MSDNVGVGVVTIGGILAFSIRPGQGHSRQFCCPTHGASLRSGRIHCSPTIFFFHWYYTKNTSLRVLRSACRQAGGYGGLKTAKKPLRMVYNTLNMVDLRTDPFWSGEAQFVETFNGAIRVFNATGRVHAELLESALGIGGTIQQGNIRAAHELEPALRVLTTQIQTDPTIHPADASQLPQMLISTRYPYVLRELIATQALGYASVETMEQSIKTSSPGIENLG